LDTGFDDAACDSPDFADRLVARYGAFWLLANRHPPIAMGQVATESPDIVWVCGDWVSYASMRLPHCSRLVPRTREFDHAFARCCRNAAGQSAAGHDAAGQSEAGHEVDPKGTGPTLGDMRLLTGCADLVGAGHRHCFELYLPSEEGVDFQISDGVDHRTCTAPFATRPPATAARWLSAAAAAVTTGSARRG
jgi:hypothetical protein